MTCRRVACALSLVAAVVASPRAHADFIDHFAAPDDIGILKVPRAGKTRILVIPLLVDNLPFEQSDESAFLQELAAFFDPTASGWAFTPYWRTASLGRFEPVATVAAPVRIPSCPRLGAYEDCEIPRGAGISSGDLQGALAVLADSFAFLDEVFRCASTGPSAGLRCTEGGGVRWADFDASGPVPGTPDGVVDGVILVSNGSFPGIALPLKELSTNPLLQFVGPFPSFTYDDVTVGAVAISGRAERPRRGTWVSVHEFGHLLGFADLYDESGQTTDMPYSLMGGWYYADPGSLLDPFSRIAAGWGHVVQASGAATFELGPADLTGTVLKVGTGDEFFLVELRTRRRGVIDGDLQVDFGVVVERARLSQRPKPDRGSYLETLQECVNCVSFDTFLSMEQADGELGLERGIQRNDAEDLFFAGSEIVPSSDTAPRSLDHLVFSTNRLDGSPTGITIRVLEASADRAVIEVDGEVVPEPCAELAPFCGDLSCSAVDGGAECGAIPPPPRAVVPPEGCDCRETSQAPLWLAMLGTLCWRQTRSGRRRDGHGAGRCA